MAAQNEWLLTLYHLFLSKVLPYDTLDDPCKTLTAVSRDLLQTPRDEAVLILETLTLDAHKQMPMASPSQLSHLRHLYIDGSILLAMSHLLSCQHADSETKRTSEALHAISALDKAIIIAGPTEDRVDLIHSLISSTQAQFLPVPSSGTASSLSTSPPPAPGLATSHQVPILASLPSLITFKREASLAPFVLKGFASDWPAVSSWSSPQYLIHATGPGRVVPVEVGSDYRADEWSQTLMPWEDFLGHLFAQSTANGKVLYLAQHNLFSQFPILRNDFDIPDYVYSVLDAPSNFPGYNPPPNDEQLVVNAWFGRGGARSPAHTDPFFNFYAQIAGYKEVWLAPPSVSSYMYPLENGHSSNPAENKHASPGMSNTSQVDVFGDGPVNEFPAFDSHVRPVAMSLCLGPGDVLFFPPGWWHAMRVVGEDASMSVSFWF